MFNFGKIKINPPKRSLLDLSHDVKLSMNMGKLVPFLCQETIPGDTWKMNSEIFLRFAPMLAPIMHRVNVKTYFFFVPFRLIWDDWKEFITQQQSPEGFIPVPNIEISKVGGTVWSKHGSLLDYLGFPSINPNDTLSINYKVNALPFRAYQLIYNEWFRNQTLQNEVEIYKGSDDVSSTQHAQLLELRNKNWELDYFTSCLPFAQRGEAAKIPVGIEGQFPVEYGEANNKASNIVDPATGEPLSDSYQDAYVQNSSGEAALEHPITSDSKSILVTDERDKYVEINLSDMQGTINDLRLMTKIQRWLENNARGGGRYIEQIMAHFGVKSSDARLQRPEFLGGGQSPVVISQVLQQSQSVGDEQSIEPSTLGDMAGHGVSVGQTHTFKKYFEEHGYIIGVMCVLPRTSYQQGIPRQYMRKYTEDFYFPEFANLGEQEVSKHELYFNPASLNINSRFGYQQRYAEYRYIPSSVHGDFKDSLDFWHLGRKFENAPSLNSEFVEADLNNDTYNRIFAVTSSDYDHLWVQIYNNIKAARPMPKYPTPSLV